MNNEPIWPPPLVNILYTRLVVFYLLEGD